MTNRFDDWFYDQCAVDAAEMVGPNSLEYDRLCERYLEDETRREAAMHRFRMETGEDPRDD